MIRMIQSTSSGHAKAYFSEALAKSDYYLSDQELPGLMQGKLAARLGLSGQADKETFFALCENRNPATGEHLTPRTNTDRTVGYDINFHCPKSVSILHALAQDDHILAAFQESVTETMQRIEADARTRVRQGGVYADRQTGELAWAQFVHQTARPVEGHLPDPHLHAHCFTFNATWDAAEDRFKAGQFREIKRDMPFYQAHFHKSLADKMAGLGYRVRSTDTSFEIEGVPEQVIRHFSKRTDQIGRVAAEKGITDAKELSELGARTRASKDKGLTMAELQSGWREQIAALGAGRQGEEEKAVRFAPVKETSSLTPRECVDYAVLHSFERASVMEGRRILEAAVRRSIGVPGVTADDIATAFEEDKRVIHVEEKGRKLCTTKDVLNEERRMVDLARSGQGQMIPLYAEAPETGLLGQQAAAVEHILTTAHRVSIIRGVAGSGKTTLMKEAVGKIEEAGKTVITVAPTAQASRGVLKEEGFEKATTVAHLLADKTMQATLKNQVLWVDEAGLLGTKDMTALLELAKQQNARLILGGDTRQHASVVRGDALRILNTVAHIPVAEVAKIYRQTRADYRQAVADLSEGRIAEGFQRLDGVGCIKDAGAGTLVQDYVAVIKRGKSALVVSPTHAQGEAVTQDIRTALRDEGLLGKKEIEADSLKNLNLTQAEKSDPKNFAPGQIVQFNQNTPRFKRGSQWTVAGITATEVRIQNGEDARSLPLAYPSRFDVFDQETIPLSKGDKIRITKNGFDADKGRLNNGDMLTVVSVSKRGTIVLQNDRSKALHRLESSFGHLAHAHCITSHASQGKTVDEVFIYQPAGTFPATDAKQFYVSVSRARDMAHIYTDDKEELLHHAQRLRDRQSAIELVERGREYEDNERRMIQEQHRIQEERDGYEPDI